MSKNQKICPSCGGVSSEKLESGYYLCPYCDSVFNEYKVQSEEIAIANTKTSNKQYEKAKHAFENGEFEQCIAYCDLILEEAGEDYLVYYLKALAISNAPLVNKFDRTIDNFEKAYKYAGENREVIGIDIHNMIIDIALIGIDSIMYDPNDSSFYEDIELYVDSLIARIEEVKDIFNIDMEQLILNIANYIGNNTSQLFLDEVYAEFDQYKYPNDEQWHKYLHATDQCIKTLSYSCDLIDRYKLSRRYNIDRYKNINDLLDQTIDTHSYHQQVIDGNTKWLISKQLTSTEKSKRKDYIETVASYISNYDSNYKKPKSGCFIATAVYESYTHPKVIVLRRYRDKVLKRSYLGRSFIKIYYSISPKLVKIFYGNNFVKKMARSILNKFVIYASKKTE